MVYGFRFKNNPLYSYPFPPLPASHLAIHSGFLAYPVKPVKITRALVESDRTQKQATAKAPW